MVLTHDQCRAKVCCLCWRKSAKPMKPSQVVLVQVRAILDYDATDPTFPTGLCGSCRIALLTHNGKNLKISTIHRISRRNSSRSKSLCVCLICKVGKMNGLQALNLKGNRGRPSHSSKMARKVMKVCSNCKTIVYPGCKHSLSSCRSQRKIVNNIRNYFLNNEKLNQQIVSKILKGMSGELNGNIVLKTFGRSLKVCLGKQNSENCVLSEPDIYSIKLN